jgi:hypothetical protein
MAENLRVVTQSLDKVDAKAIRVLLDRHGYAIVRVTSWVESVKRLREELISKLGHSADIKKGISWKPYLGMANFQGFSDNSFNKIYRLFNFRWNLSDSELLIDLIDEMERFKLPLIGCEGGQPDYDYYYSASLYPPDGGFMRAHTDGVTSSSSPLIHVLLPITFRGIDYFEGGQFIYINNKKVDTDRDLRPGDLIIYNGALEHGVNPVKGGCGRIQIFGVPVKFQSPEENIEFLRALPLKVLIRPKLLRLKNVLYSLLGKSFIRN